LGVVGSAGAGPAAIVGDVLVLLSPGQGSQSPGMLLPWTDVPGALDDLAAWSEVTGLDLLSLGTEAGAERLRDTAVAQPLLTATALLSARALGDVRPAAVVGHSVGELSALAVAGVLDETTAVRLAAERGAAMAGAAAARPTGMAALLGGVPDEIATAAQRHGLSVATVNGAGQTVVGGPVEGLDALAAAPPAGARVRRLDVAGAFHTEAMRPAVARLAELVAGLDPAEPRCAVVANADGAAGSNGRDLLDRLVAQLTGPVRFDRCLDRLRELGATAVVELAPGGTLAGVVRRALPDTTVVALRTAADVDAARAQAPGPVAA
jgi:[acyl-carrier-protein] S-malonyltransferase